MRYNRCGQSGRKLLAISLGLWHNFGGVNSFEKVRALIHTAFDHRRDSGVGLPRALCR
jgi:L-glyceraldehyde 3-phosphate reductase